MTPGRPGFDDMDDDMPGSGGASGMSEFDAMTSAEAAGEDTSYDAADLADLLGEKVESNDDDEVEVISGADDSRQAVGVLHREMKRIAAERDELKDQYVRSVAEMDNMRKRMDREVQKARDFAIEKFAQALLPVADNLELALKNTPSVETDEIVRQFVTGVEMTQRELMKAFEGNKLVRMDAMGAKLDPNLHHAIQQDHDASVPHESVVEVYQPGYTISERLLRPALVKVSTGGPRMAAESEEAASAAEAPTATDAPASPPEGDGPPADEAPNS